MLSWAQVELLIESVLELPDAPPSRWHRPGIGPRRERWFERVSAVVLLTFAVGWCWTLVHGAARADAAGNGDVQPTVGARLAAALTAADAPAMAYLTDAALAAVTPLRGESGRLRARFETGEARLPVDSLPPGASVAIASPRDTIAVAGDSAAATAPKPGLWNLVVRAGTVIKPVADFTVVTMVPTSARRNGRIGLYYIGNWPTERGRVAARGNYAPPRGFIEVTRENQDTRVSEHFRLRDFLTKNQQDVWPKYLVLETRLLDKLELVLADLEKRGIRTHGVKVMSGFRTPSYNASGGNTAGRASLSRHMYGDASDIYIDSDGNGMMDDLNGDGRVNTADARVILQAAERVEREHPALVGGVGVYSYGPGHGPFIHIDTRGFRARWVGAGE